MNEDTSLSGQSIALVLAESYLITMGFSRKWLIRQLEFEGCTAKEAIYAADNCGADWKEQAARVAKNYLNKMSLSIEKLIAQLAFQGFTEEEAIYGADAACK